MAPVVPDNHDLITSLCGSPYPAISHFSPAAAVTHCALPVLDQTSAPEIFALLRDLDTLQQLYNDTLSEMCSLKSTLSLEKKLREAAETTCADLEKEKELLVESQLASFEQIVKQLDYGSKYGNSMQSLEDAKSELASLAKFVRRVYQLILVSQVQEMHIASLNSNHAITEEDLRKQVRDLKMEAEAKARAMAGLEKQLSQTVTPEFFKLKQQETEQQVHEKYLVDLAELRKTLKSEEMKKQKLETDLKEAQQSSISWKVKYEDQLREMNTNRHANVFKQKVMKLRKDNEMLRRQLQDLQKHR